MPGDDWATSFIGRHQLTTRLADNVTSACISKAVIDEFFDNLESEIKDVPPTHLFNFDETNFTDDPKKKKLSLIVSVI